MCIAFAEFLGAGPTTCNCCPLAAATATMTCWYRTFPKEISVASHMSAHVPLNAPMITHEELLVAELRSLLVAELRSLRSVDRRAGSFFARELQGGVTNRKASTMRDESRRPWCHASTTTT